MGMVRPGWLRAGGAAVITLLAFGAGAASTLDSDGGTQMDLGTFSVSLSVKDLAASKAFYERLGFAVIAGEENENWLILKNGDAKIGIFQDKFEGNLLTFNPEDVRPIHASLKGQGVEMMMEHFPAPSGPAHFVIRDPDGNVILLDQH